MNFVQNFIAIEKGLKKNSKEYISSNPGTAWARSFTAKKRTLLKVFKELPNIISLQIKGFHTFLPIAKIEIGSNHSPEISARPQKMRLSEYNLCSTNFFTIERKPC